MENRKTGEFISNLRKKRNMTQKELADLLGVTDKAVSKWERGAGYPDIGLLKPLSAALNITVNELLEGEALQQLTSPDNDNVNSLPEGAVKTIHMRHNQLSKILALTLIIMLLLAIFTSLIVNIAVNHQFTWSILVVTSCFMGSCLFVPPLLWKKRGLFFSLCLLTVLILPFLGIIQLMTSGHNSTSWLWNLGLPISVTWLSILWILAILYHKLLRNLWYIISAGIILGIPGQLVTNYIIDRYLIYRTEANIYTTQVTTLSTSIGLLIIAGICFVAGRNRHKINPLK